MRPMAVVMVDIDAQHLLELSPADDQDPVEAVPADGADPAFGERVCLRRAKRCGEARDGVEAVELVDNFPWTSNPRSAALFRAARRVALPYPLFCLPLGRKWLDAADQGVPE